MEDTTKYGRRREILFQSSGRNVPCRCKIEDAITLPLALHNQLDHVFIAYRLSLSPENQHFLLVLAPVLHEHTQREEAARIRAKSLSVRGIALLEDTLAHGLLRTALPKHGRERKLEPGIGVRS